MGLYSQDIPHDWAEITPNNDTDLPPNRGIQVTAAGTVSILNKAGVAISLGSLPVGYLHIGRVRRVRATGTTATVIRVI